MSPEQMRHYIKTAYPGDKWQTRVARMSDNQVAAVYTRLLNKQPIIRPMAKSNTGVSK